MGRSMGVTQLGFNPITCKQIPCSSSNRNCAVLPRRNFCFRQGLSSIIGRGSVRRRR